MRLNRFPGKKEKKKRQTNSFSPQGEQIYLHTHYEKVKKKSSHSSSSILSSPIISTIPLTHLII